VQQLMRLAHCQFSKGNIVDECGIDGTSNKMYDILNGTLSDYDIKRLVTHDKTTKGGTGILYTSACSI
jgi:hypothetical protein